MCGIVGVVADLDIGKSPTSMLVDGLQRLEYRGYDSAGFALLECNTGRLLVFKDKGKIKDIVEKYSVRNYCCIAGIAHTRWATHGAPTQVNAHPHTDCANRIAIVHNGIIKNFSSLKEYLIEKGHRFVSDTDTEVVSHLFEDFLNQGYSPLDALRKTIKMLEGTYAIAIIHAEEPHRIYFARNISPLIIGLGEGFNLVSSDIPSILPYTRRIVVIRDGEIGYIEPYKVYIEYSGRRISWQSRISYITWSLEESEKGGYPHYMLKEIMEQPRVLQETIVGLSTDDSIQRAAEILNNSSHIFITGAGTSFHAGLIFSYFLSRIANRPSYCFISSEYESLATSASSDSVLVAISQSGETIDTLMALRAFRERGAKIVSISNVIGSSIPRESDITIYTRAGPEIGVAATKTYLTQTLALTYLAVELGAINKSIDNMEAKKMYLELSRAGRITSRSLDKTSKSIELLAESLKRHRNIYVLGRGLGSLIAYEAALKIKEVSYIHAEAYPAGESKHGPIALVEEKFPVIFIAAPPSGTYFEKLQGNIMEMKSRGASTIVVGASSYRNLVNVDYFIDVGEVEEITAIYALTPPLQLLAYKLAVLLGRDPDKPRNLAKTVTVE